MSSHSQSHRGLVAVTLLAAFAVLCGAGTLAAAQDQPPPKWELFGGYSFFYPGADVNGVLPGGLIPVTSRLESNPRGIGASVTYNFNRWFGLTVDSSGHWGSGEAGLSRLDDAGFYNVSLGPKLTFRRAHFAPFIEAMVGWHRLTSDTFDSDNRVGFIGGGGIDVPLSQHFGLRLIQGDYVVSNHHFGPSSIIPSTLVEGVRLQSGLVFMFGGGGPAAPVAASCSVSSSEVMVGEPVTATVTASNFNPNHTLTYTWSSTGGKVSGKDTTATIDTNGVAGGSYTVTASVSDPKVKKGGEASCTANFTVKEPPKNPPTISCLASPSTVQTGTPSTIRCTCTSPDNVPVTLSGWTSSEGSVSGSGNSASLNTTGASPGSITVSATCTDSRGLTASASAQVRVENPPPVSSEVQRLESRLALHSIYFPTAQPTVANPNGGLLASQQQTLISLADDFRKYLETKPDAHLTLEGHADPRGSVAYNQALSERRVERTKGFLIERGVPEANLETKGFGLQRNLTDAEVKDAVEKNPELTPGERQRVLKNMRTIILAANRRVDVTLSTTGQQSTRQYPFNAADSLTLLRQQGTRKTTGPAAKKKAKPKVPQ